MAEVKFPVEFKNGVPFKTCTGCLVEQEVNSDNFRPHPTYQWGRARCRGCERKERKAYKSKRIEHYKAYDKSRKYRQHGLTETEWEAMYEEQDGRCAICKDALDIDELKIDHCHDSGIVRGLLCNKCNVALGMLEDDVDRLQTAIAYILKSRAHSH